MGINNVVKELEYKGHTVTVYYDNDPCGSPREWDNLGTMLCFHSRYSLGDSHNLDVKAIERIIKSKDVVALPLYLYDHSGITMRTAPFMCPWDSGRVGYIYVTKANIRKEHDCQRVSAKLIKEVQRRLNAEVELYNMFLTGQVYGYEVTDSEDDCIDSCWGFITDDIDSVVEEAKNILD